MRAYRRTSSVWQMVAAVCVFVAAMLLLESGGLYDWATRLEVGPLRAAALPVATALHERLHPLGLEAVRTEALDGLARVRWSDDPATLAKVNAPERAPAIATVEAADRAVTSASPVVLNVGAKSVAGGSPTVPKATVLRPLLPLTDAPPMTSRLPKLAPIAPGKTRTIALVGDSMMAVGLATTILRESPKYQDVSVVKAFRSGTGLARPEVFDWQAEYPAMLQQARPEVVVVAMGANDGQGFVENGITYPFGSDGWKQIYQSRVQAFLEMLQAGGATVVWVALPPMKSPAYDERIALINQIDYAVVKASPRAIWFSTAGVVGSKDGAYAEFGRVQGTTQKLRQPDGVHFSDEGASLLTAKLMPWLGQSGEE